MALDVPLFGLISLAHMTGPAFAKAEIMRYLAEIAWATDAMLINRSLVWSVIDSRTLKVAASSEAGHRSVRIDLDDEGRIGGIFASNRPLSNGKTVEERAWSGRFFDYRRHAGRWLPSAPKSAGASMVGSQTTDAERWQAGPLRNAHA
ncbi:DUF6544 family protein [Sphingomonas sp.]|uniref:DUF6544 family protein n=1 Tax=Sphingomonas sp. TaxID=28214 RepID=UPI0025E81F9C|nr:DUF6544 family protein [Sphingomonas sp.]